ncbi:MAG: DinB family protein [Pleurocapsa sp. SU_196_0]|nr:DinB family protein [Pleurocapsa sp. SU_196_0]
MLRPDASEYPHRYQRYIDLVPETDILSAFEVQCIKSRGFLKKIPESESQRQYTSNKWSIKEVVGHLIDVGRIFSLRILRFSRGDSRPRMDFDFDKTQYVQRGLYNEARLSSLSAEFLWLR